jgi:hypothetical protein
MDPLEAYDHCRKHAYHNRWTPQRHYDWEDVANDAWIIWREQHEKWPHLHPFRYVEQTMMHWWDMAKASKRGLTTTKQLSYNHRVLDDPSGQAIVNETLSLTLETMLRTTRNHKPAVEHVATLLLEGYMPFEIMASNDYEYAFLNGIRAKMAVSMPDDMGKLIRFSHKITSKQERIERRRHQIKMAARKYRAEAAGTPKSDVARIYSS